MYRSLILITNNGTEENHLDSVTVDREHYLTFFKSAEGGAWKDSEITVFDNNATRVGLRKFFYEHSNNDFYMIVFCGRGYYTYDNQTILELSPNNDCPAHAIKQWVSGKICMLIADFCRTPHSHTPLIDSNKKERRLDHVPNPTDAYLETCRRKYEDYIEDMMNEYPAGYFAEAYSCSQGESAHHNEIEGGYYSYCLLSAALSNIARLRRNHSAIRPEIGTFSKLHDNVSVSINALSMKKHLKPQTPNRFNGLDIPFYVVPSSPHINHHPSHVHVSHDHT